MLDPDLWYQYERIKHSYANILFKWGLLNERRQVLKHTVAAEADIKGIEVNVTCWNCSREVRGAQCTECSYPALQCSICHIGVRGAANMCIACGHGGHLAHLMEWFKEYDVCPTGCGCHCLQENIF
ncbi:WD repeat-containing protein 59 [Plakobranchus ocellatus]|uniref:WD repeat-containing protein 59 n=1 Tax=Plakobranchus ocellatus TaxID=259542 RepID=A0AAV4DH27_9GAST|nr:WD repeat-containing protein 59 [Plakobranchus ocellatus]